MQYSQNLRSRGTKMPSNYPKVKNIKKEKQKQRAKFEKEDICKHIREGLKPPLDLAGEEKIIKQKIISEIHKISNEEDGYASKTQSLDAERNRLRTMLSKLNINYSNLNSIVKQERQVISHLLRKERLLDRNKMSLDSWRQASWEENSFLKGLLFNKYRNDYLHTNSVAVDDDTPVNNDNDMSFDNDSLNNHSSNDYLHINSVAVDDDTPVNNDNDIPSDSDDLNDQVRKKNSWCCKSLWRYFGYG